VVGTTSSSNFPTTAGAFQPTFGGFGGGGAGGASGDAFVAKISTITNGPPSCTIVTDLLAWWPGDGNANDIIGSNQGILQNGATFAQGLVGPAFSLNNPGSALPSPCPSCAYVSVANNLPASVNEVTVEAWIYPTQTNVQYAQWIYTQYPTGPQLGFDGTGEDIFWRPNVDGGAFHVPGSLPLNTWTHIAGTYSSITGLAQLYVDGNVVGSIGGAQTIAFQGPPYAGPIPLTATPFIGKRLQQEFFGGLVDELSIYDRALTASEVQAIFNAASAGKCKPAPNNPPVARCQNVTVAAASSCTASASIDNGSFDPDSGDTITLSQSPSGPYPLGSTPVTLTVTDNHGASSQCTATVTVVDASPPVPDLAALPVVTAQCSATLTPPTAHDNCAGLITATTGDPISYNAQGTFTVHWAYNDGNGNISTQNQTIIIKDTIAPTIIAPPAVTVNTGPGATSCGVTVADAVLGVATATDNCSGVTVTRSGVPPANLFPVGATTITYTATDAVGNNASATQTVTVIDNTPPIVACATPLRLEFTSVTGAVATFSPAATDNCSVATVVCSPASGSTFPIGTTTVTCTATDAGGNQASCSFTVTVLGALGVKQDVLGDLTALRKTITNKQDGDKLDDAIKHLTASLDPKLWVDQTHLDPKGGGKAFEEEKDTVTGLRDLFKDNESGIPTSVLQGFINRIVDSDQLLAVVAINDAVAGGGDPKKIAESQDELGKGNTDFSAGRYDTAIEHYEQAWNKALDALKKDD
jgi:hypothetical protein